MPRKLLRRWQLPSRFERWILGRLPLVGETLIPVESGARFGRVSALTELPSSGRHGNRRSGDNCHAAGIEPSVRSTEPCYPRSGTAWRYRSESPGSELGMGLGPQTTSTTRNSSYFPLQCCDWRLKWKGNSLSELKRCLKSLLMNCM